MAIDLATKYSTVVDEKFRLASLTNIGVNQNYDWDGVNSIHVYDISTAIMNNYTRNGGNRYGTPAEQDRDATQYTLSRDRSFTQTIDQGNYDETMMVSAAGESLSRQIAEVIIPEIDTWRLNAMAAGAGFTSTPTPITAANAFESLLDADSELTNNKVPLQGRVVFCTPNYFKFIRLDENFVKRGDLSQEMMINGVVGEAAGMAIVQAPTVYFPADVEFIVTHPVATVAPIKLLDYRAHENPPGINGWLLEGRTIYDAFVLKNKMGAVYVHKSA